MSTLSVLVLDYAWLLIDLKSQIVKYEELNADCGEDGGCIWFCEVLIF